MKANRMKQGKRRAWARLGALLACCALALSACGDKAASAPEEATVEPSPSEAQPTATPKPAFTPDPHLNPASSLVGLVIADTNGLLSKIAAHGFLRTAENLGYSAKLYSAATSEEAAALVDRAIDDGCKGLLIWADSPAMQEAATKADAAGIPVVVPYCENGDANVDANLKPDVNDFAPEAARILCAQLESKGKTNGVIVVTGAAKEPAIADAFEAKIKADFSQYSVVRLDGEPTEESITEFVRKNGDLAGVLSLDESSGKLWSKVCANVQSELKAAIKTPDSTPKPDAPTPTPNNSYKRSAVVLVLDYTEAHLAWVRDGLVYGVIARPYYDSTAKSMAVLDRILRGIPTQTNVRLDAPVIRKNAVAKYVALALEVKEWFGV